MALFNFGSSSPEQRILNDPYYRLQSLEEVRIAATLGLRLDVNRAGVDDWLRLPGVSIHQARLLADLSQSGVHFYCLEDLAAALGIPLHRLQPLAPVLNFCYYEGEAFEALQPLNPNTASIELLTRIPSVDLFLARAIVENRQSFGAYRNLVDLQRRLSLPPKIVAELMHYLRF